MQTHVSPVCVSMLSPGRITHCTHNTPALDTHISDECLCSVCVFGVLPLKSLCSRCLQSDGSWVAAFRSRHTADSETRDVTFSRRRTRNSSSGGRTARPKRAGSPNADTHTHVINTQHTTWYSKHACVRNNHPVWLRPWVDTPVDL